jgi:hypothetical protein
MRRCRSAEERLPFEVKVLRISLEAFGRSDGLDRERSPDIELRKQAGSSDFGSRHDQSSFADGSAIARG